MQNFKIILATNNMHKKKEFAHALQVNVFTPNDLQIATFDPIENASTFSENAMLKAEALYDILDSECMQKKCIIVADDSGLCVQALNNEPGIFSARYANIQNGDAQYQNASDEDNRAALISKLKACNLWGSKAFFQCSIAYIVQDNGMIVKQGVVEGKCHGIVAIKELGAQGFGYDCMFYRDLEKDGKDSQNIDFSLQNADVSAMHVFHSLSQSLATLSLEQKTDVSHRGQALVALKRVLQTL